MSHATVKPMADLLAEALRYRAIGWSLIPIRPGDKLPVCPWKHFQSQPASDDQLRQWFEGDDRRNLAVVCGRVSGDLAVRDFDERDAYECWAQEHAEHAAGLPTVTTARGYHVYFRSLSPLKTTDLGDGELRGEGGYCVLPPSKHPDGSQYRWTVPLAGQPPLIDPSVFMLQRATETTEDNRGQQKPLREGISVVSADSVALCYTPSLDVEAAILDSLPQQRGQRNKQVFRLTRGLKAVPHLADADPRSLRPLVEEWHRLALPVIGTLPFEETWIDFLQAWPRVKYPLGTGPMAEVFARARDLPLPMSAERYEQAELRLLVAVCRELQVSAGAKPFFLSVRTAGKLIGRDHVTAWRWLFLLESDGVLEVVERGGQRNQKATRYRYLGE